MERTLQSTFIRIVGFFVVLSVGIFLATHTAHADHFRAGTMSWEPIGDEEKTVLIKVGVGWTLSNGHIPSDAEVGDVFTGKVDLHFGDGSSSNSAVRVTSINTNTDDVQTELVSVKDGDESYTEGVEHTYENDGDYVAYWSSTAREVSENGDDGDWRNEMLVNIGGEYSGNTSPISAVPSIVQVPDNTLFEYKLTGIDSDGDDVQFRYGTKQEFFGTGSGAATRPTGLSLDSDGTVAWDVRDSELDTTIGDRWQMTVMAEDLDEEGEVKSYIPLDFMFLISDSTNTPPTASVDEDSHAGTVGEEVTFTLTGVDPDWEEGDESPDISVVNPPSSDADVWDTTETADEATTTMDVSFTPSENMSGDSFVVIFQVTDSGGNADTETVSVNVAEIEPLDIADLNVEVDGMSATASWATDEPGSSQVVYGPTNTYGVSTSEYNTDPRVTNHTVELSELLACTTYHYAVVSKGEYAANAATSSDNTFTTGDCDGGGSVSAQTSNSFNSNEGGTLQQSAGDSSLAVALPENVTSTSSSVVIQVSTLGRESVLSSLGEPSGRSTFSDVVFDVKAIVDGTTILDSFAAPVTITYEYTDEEIEDMDESTLWLYHHHKGDWDRLDDCVLDQDANTIECTTESFSIFSLFGDTPDSPSRSSGSRIGCKDPEAINYERYVSHNEDRCEYEVSTEEIDQQTEPSAPMQTLTALVEENRELLLQAVAAGIELPEIVLTMLDTSSAEGSSHASTSTSTIRDLTLTDEGDDVTALQNLLIDSSAGPSTAELSRVGASGYFGSYTANALTEYQQQNNIQPPNGYFGPVTRAQMEAAGLEVWW